MKKKVTGVLFFVILLASLNVQSQDNQSGSAFIGEINPSIQLKGPSQFMKTIIDFEGEYMLLFGEEKVEQKSTSGSTYFIRGKVFSLVDLKNKKFGKISIASNIVSKNLSEHDLAIPIYRFSKFNIKMFLLNPKNAFRVFLFVNYEDNSIYTIEAKSNPDYRYQYKNKNYLETGNFYLSKSLELVVELVEQSASNKKNTIYVVYDKQSNIVATVTKNKDFTKFDCVYTNYNVVPTWRKRLNHTARNESCAFSPNEVCAYARVPKTDFSMGKYIAVNPDENINTAYIEFFNPNNDSPAVYTHNFIFDRGRVESALVSFDLKYILINNQYIYSLPSIKVAK